MDETQTKDLKKELCVNRCCYKFYATTIDHIVDEPNKTQTEKTKEGILVCEACGHTQDIEFE